ncbi:MAG: hypothetical protein UW46_C0013G0003 [Candidatus Yanofskybacteria bacterium GW2011_GWF1_44_227]|uniref:CBU-0592-like domain-containing protein n=1 Tax=Candidatus Yanofskybacteria bacterium GW2011_GWE2_40_11 TaxID=1619033 RepID=A0A0G0QR06_9BACT|nr:MAG: hypothetical protein UT75_C0013G0013 [Candidatus Yanofskybacteria bacterium GW2011_GWE2_40_11]KKT14929.1 MAG: hypothetical protein UV97_C0014G0003 [Candidatus Yanofskybacteria bacterium GW2011_GWF2_43_596]KKT52702.1 MAG: hypothetical protein UW46_C0013G0003 [Candidatus Yanofskybacteria bacterium GW2011_GWF1_44_227]OGN35804.1 MAG: hypothetical protein A2207_03825 [Candidatus Yanofskybacteria bacterium RIFOXYA1_FULL_44_17]OGN35823.1 MAG: hypothetical protein A2241_03565 [Candidatus Yanofs
MFIKNHKIVGAYGWYGMVAIVLAYALNNFGVISVSGYWYPFLNITGSLGIIADSWYHKAWQSVILNVVWIIVAIFALIKSLYFQ